MDRRLGRAPRPGPGIAFQRTFPTSGTHKIRIVCAGTISHPRINVDALVVLR